MIQSGHELLSVIVDRLLASPYGHGKMYIVHCIVYNVVPGPL